MGGLPGVGEGLCAIRILVLVASFVGVLPGLGGIQFPKTNTVL